MNPERPEAGPQPQAATLPANAKRARLTIMIAGALFVLVPSSEAVHAFVRATLGVGGVQCC